MSIFFFVLVHEKLSTRLKLLIQKAFTFLLIKLKNLTIFARRNFENNLDPARFKRLNQLSTRLYIILLFSGLVALGLHTLTQTQKVERTVIKPSLLIYEHLFSDHNDTLQCPCSLISSTYDYYVRMEPTFHQVRYTNMYKYCIEHRDN